MRLSRLFGSLLAVALLATPHAALAANASLAGTYTYDPAASDDVNQAIETAVAKMNFILRPIAHSRLRATNVPHKRLAIGVGASEVSVTFDREAPIKSPANGKSVKWKREDGELLTVSTALQGGTQMDETFIASDGRRVNHYALSPDGKKLTMTATIVSPKLPRPLTYKLAYRRSN